MTTIEVDNIKWDGVEWSALRYVNPMIEATGAKFVMSVYHWSSQETGTGYEYLINGQCRRVAYKVDGNSAVLIFNDTGVVVPDRIEVVERKRKRPA